MTDAVKQLREYLKNGPHDTYVPYEIADEALTALEAVLELHKPFDWSFSAGDQVYTITSCSECARLGADEEYAIYPCPTVQAITNALGDDDAQ